VSHVLGNLECLGSASWPLLVGALQMNVVYAAF